jgi:benzoyl-CoA reductase/2-hydroxyglutaryl-CoA dehydratase subunit BcrC/BadD/HgdB
MHVMDLPQLPDEPEALETWTSMIHKLRRFLERVFERTTSEDRIEEAIRDSNAKARQMNKVFDYLALNPTVLGWEELYDVFLLAQGASGHETGPLLDEILRKLEDRKRQRYIHGAQGAPRVRVTGCPVGGDASKVFRAIEGAGGVIVAMEDCSGMKPYIIFSLT